MNLHDIVNDIKNEESINERVFRKRVLRNGKLLWKKKTDRANYKIVNGREVRMKRSEIIKRKKAQRRGKLKRRSKQPMIKFKLQRAARKRKAMGL